MRALEKKIYDYLEAHREDIVADLVALARAESPTGDKAAADACARRLASLYKDRLGAATQFVPQTEVGDHLVTEIGSGPRTLLIVGHYDTVHPLGTVPVRREGNILYGPGVVDMKGGDVSVIWALKALREL
ncbi:MAG: M20/M25/M40 family metallo-hydrolase, partial [Pyramidobacter sp.]|nr:M20/M25/M40 family metallo-hydrolase [Pyramidobacter sp.]